MTARFQTTRLYISSEQYISKIHHLHNKFSNRSCGGKALLYNFAAYLKITALAYLNGMKCSR